MFFLAGGDRPPAATSPQKHPPISRFRSHKQHEHEHGEQPKQGTGKQRSQHISHRARGRSILQQLNEDNSERIHTAVAELLQGGPTLREKWRHVRCRPKAGLLSLVNRLAPSIDAVKQNTTNIPQTPAAIFPSPHLLSLASRSRWYAVGSNAAPAPARPLLLLLPADLDLPLSTTQTSRPAVCKKTKSKKRVDKMRCEASRRGHRTFSCRPNQHFPPKEQFANIQLWDTAFRDRTHVD